MRKRTEGGSVAMWIGTSWSDEDRTEELDGSDDGSGDECGVGAGGMGTTSDGVSGDTLFFFRGRLVVVLIGASGKTG